MASPVSVLQASRSETTFAKSPYLKQKTKNFATNEQQVSTVYLSYQN